MAVIDDATAQGKFRAFAPWMRNLDDMQAIGRVRAIILGRQCLGSYCLGGRVGWVLLDG